MCAVFRKIICALCIKDVYWFTYDSYTIVIRLIF